MTNEMIERVAKALKDNLARQFDAKPLHGDAASGDWHATGGTIELEEMARAAIDAALQWQLIETAPKDGTPILLFYADQRGMVEGYWFSSPKQTDDGWYAEIFGFPGDPDPTHWMPLPPRP